MKPTLLLSALLLAACSKPAEGPMAVDQCILKGYLQECTDESATQDEQATCRKRAQWEAMRIEAGIPPECRASKG
jgi:hypothetical protein